MASKSNIEWTGHTWNPLAGCSVVSPGCTNCYAMKLAGRLERMRQPLYAGLTKRTKAGFVWTGEMRRARESVLFAPLRRRIPTTYFVNSMSDLFHESVPDEWVLDVLDVIRRTSYDGGSNCGSIQGEHTYQLLTKRSARMQRFMNRLRWNGEKLHLADGGHPVVLKNLWLGVSTEDQQHAEDRIPDLMRTPAAVRFISAEPLLGPVDLTEVKFELMPGYFGDALQWHHRPHCDREHRYPALDWVIVGGESGPGHRDMDPTWMRSIMEQCSSAGVAFFGKQMAGRAEIPEDLMVRQFPKAA